MPKRRLRVLFVVHNHPSLYPGGAEQYALELYEELRDSSDVEPFFVARVGPTASAPVRPHPGTPLAVLGPDDPNQYLVFADGADFDGFMLTLRDKSLYTTSFPELLLALLPDVVHFQHTHYLGYQLLWATRKTLPGAPLVYTLHDYWSICHRDGLMLRSGTDELCLEESPRRCNQCFSDISPGMFFIRKRFIQSHLRLIDLFLAPSHFLRERYMEWGIAEDRILFNDYGRRLAPQAPTGDRSTRDRFAFFGQFAPYKGTLVLLEAIESLSRGSVDGSTAAAKNAHFWLHGANLEWRAPEFQERFHALVESNRACITVGGRYNASDIRNLMADIDWVIVPSTWWENSPLVIQEAFHHSRPVICSGIGGMAEKVADGVNGLYFRVGDAMSLADAIERAVKTPDLWEDLRQGIPKIKTVAEDAAGLVEIYRRLLARRVRIAS
jgi:glycosyltransferase involved in cell wall biosynthesis